MRIKVQQCSGFLGEEELTSTHLRECTWTNANAVLFTWLSRLSGSAPPGPRSHADALSLPSVAAQCRGVMPTASVLRAFVGHPASVNVDSLVIDRCKDKEELLDVVNYSKELRYIVRVDAAHK